MEPFRIVTSVAAPLRIVNVDTDMIIPKEHLKNLTRFGLGRGLFEEMRYQRDGSEDSNFVLNKTVYRSAKILITGDNFGCGSSREQAAWALLDFGIRCLISTSFADIFNNNCAKNGILLVLVSADVLEKLLTDAERGAEGVITVDLPSQQIRRPNGDTISFEIDPFRKSCLLEGQDEIDLTLAELPTIADFESKHARSYPWL